MHQRIICHQGRCVDGTYPRFSELNRSPADEIEYELLRKDEETFAGGF